MKKITKTVIALAAGVMIFCTYGCQKEENASDVKKIGYVEVSDSLKSVFAKTGIQFPSVVEGRLAFASDEAFKEYKRALLEIDMGHLYSFTGSHSFLSLNSLDYLEDEDYIKVTSNGVEHVEIADPYFKSILNPAYEFQIDNRIVKVTNEFVFAYTKGMQNLMDEFKSAFVEGKVKLDFEQEFRYSKDLFVFRVAQNKADKGRDNATSIKSILGNKRMVLQQWQENWSFMKTIGVKIEFQEPRAVSGWKNLNAAALYLGWSNYSARGIHGYPVNYIPDGFISGANVGTIGKVFEDMGVTPIPLYGTLVPGVEYRYPHWCNDNSSNMQTYGEVHPLMPFTNVQTNTLNSNNSNWH